MQTFLLLRPSTQTSLSLLLALQQLRVLLLSHLADPRLDDTDTRVLIKPDNMVMRRQMSFRSSRLQATLRLFSVMRAAGANTAISCIALF